MKCSDLAGLVEGFFIERLMAQRRASPQTISSYRDAFRLLFTFAQERLGKTPSELRLQDLDASFLSGFLDHLERDRHNTVRSRNARLAALHSFFRYAALQYPEHSALIQRVLAMPSKRYEHPEIAFLTRPEMEALLAAPGGTGTEEQPSAHGINLRERVPHPLSGRPSDVTNPPPSRPHTPGSPPCQILPTLR